MHGAYYARALKDEFHHRSDIIRIMLGIVVVIFGDGISAISARHGRVPVSCNIRECCICIVDSGIYDAITAVKQVLDDDEIEDKLALTSIGEVQVVWYGVVHSGMRIQERLVGNFRGLRVPTSTVHRISVLSSVGDGDGKGTPNWADGSIDINRRSYRMLS